MICLQSIASGRPLAKQSSYANILKGAVKSIWNQEQAKLSFRRQFGMLGARLQNVKVAPHDLVQEPEQDLSKRPKKSRATTTKTSLRRAAIEAQKSRDGTLSQIIRPQDVERKGKTVTAYCVAEQFDMNRVVRILTDQGFKLDPCGTRLYPQVVHIEMLIEAKRAFHPAEGNASPSTGDVFIFPSGTVVAWGVPEGPVSYLASKVLVSAAVNPHPQQIETEDLEFMEDSNRENSSIKGDTIIIGTRLLGSRLTNEQWRSSNDSSVADASGVESGKRRSTDTVLAKIAFSSGLARSTKLAVLESLWSDYFESTRSIPTLLSRGSRLPFTRSFVLQKTGQLLNIRAQLNLYSELTDSLPDIFWDTRHELGLEGYYEKVGRALDVGIRIETLNEKMNYSQEIASVLREQLSEKHSLRLEWIIITLIAVEVGFEIRREWRDRSQNLTE